ncbi:hypothetical protein AVEN_51604-1 [Araneus ventricosus]|uniref:Uncharacterized protein n=1 Tax=Araneus ventricosus TaxID=182803 RepID=A0A4Y2JUW1_ARAVE|nr:hypothetical protein AVEN_51604-1 [Araneus ventricosus]
MTWAWWTRCPIAPQPVEPEVLGLNSTRAGEQVVDPRSGEARAVTGTQKIQAWKAGSGLEQEQSTGTREVEEVSRGWIEDQEGASRYFVSLNY